MSPWFIWLMTFIQELVQDRPHTACHRLMFLISPSPLENSVHCLPCIWIVSGHWVDSQNHEAKFMDWEAIALQEKVALKLLSRGVNNSKVAEREIANLRLCAMHPYIIHMREVSLLHNFRPHSKGIQPHTVKQEFAQYKKLQVWGVNQSKGSARLDTSLKFLYLHCKGSIITSFKVQSADPIAIQENDALYVIIYNMMLIAMQLLQVFLTSSHLAIVMDFAEGGNLATYIDMYQSSKAGRGISEVHSWLWLGVAYQARSKSS